MYLNRIKACLYILFEDVKILSTQNDQIVPRTTMNLYADSEKKTTSSTQDGSMTTENSRVHPACFTMGFNE